ncbi:MAG: hypothetical protein FJZ08_05940, partial [Candidatus Omnitrophica bacterium]|nr:hypothetical protein [Candidatus Omnitrophota bacterium]
MYFLGISDFQYNSGITLMEEDNMVFSINEERLSRVKNGGGFPVLSLHEMLRVTGINPATDIGHIYVSSIMNPPVFVRYFDFFRKMEEGVRVDNSVGLARLLSDFVHFGTSLTTSPPCGPYGRLTQLLAPYAIRKKLPKTMRTIPLSFIEHHLAHAASAFYTSGFRNALCITADEMGDGISLSIDRCLDKGIERIWACDEKTSFAYFYKLITEVLGFIPMRHEGKVMALAAWGDYKRVQFEFPFKSTSEGKLIYTGGFGFREVVRLRKRLLAKYSKEDIAAWLQHHCQEH